MAEQPPITLEEICPPGGTVVDPFVGSGTTGIAATLEGRGFFGTDTEAEYLQIAHARMVAWQRRAREGR